MPWRARLITSRRHPLALAGYAMSALIGLLFLLGISHSRAASQAITSGWQLVWEWELLAGGLLGFAGAVWPGYRHTDNALTAEAIGSLLAGIGFTVWAITDAATVAWAISSPSVLVFAVLAAGFMARAVQAHLERRRWRKLTRTVAAEVSP